MQILNIAGYKFIPLQTLNSLCQFFLTLCQELGLKGTVLLSSEGININLSGDILEVKAFQAKLKEDDRFADIPFHMTYSSFVPFKKLKVRVKEEIITLKKYSAKPTENNRGPSISPEILKKWLDEKRQLTLLDTRNRFEVEWGTFDNAIHLNLQNFSEFPEATKILPIDKPIVMFCTGGIRCEKAALCLLDQGFKEVYQLEGGILGYFDKVGKAYYSGKCFVFDERIVL